MLLRRFRSRLTLLMVLLTTASYFQRTIMSIAGVAISRDLHLSPVQMGEIYSAFVLGYALAMLPAGRLSDRLGPRRTLTLYATGAALLTALTAWPGTTALGASLTALLLIRFGLGVVTAPLFPSTAKMNAIWIPRRHRTYVQGWIVAGAGIGGALSPVVFIPLINAVGWRTGFVLTGAATGAIAIVWATTVRDGRRPGSEGAASLSFAEWRRILINRNLVSLSVSYATVGYFEYLFFFWIFYYLGQMRHMDSAHSGFYTSLLWVAWVVLAPLGGLAADRFTSRYGQRVGCRIVPIAALTLSVLVLVLAMNLPTAQGAALAIALCIGLAGFADSSYWTSAISIGGEYAGAAGGVMNTGSNVGGFIAPILTPWVAARVGWTNAIYLGCLVVTCGILLWPWIDTTPHAGFARGATDNRANELGAA